MEGKKAISPVIAVIIIIAVTIAIAVAVAGWMMGLWGAYTATEALTIMPDSILYTNGTLVLHVRNGGTASAVIYKVEVGGYSNTTAITPDGTISAGEEDTLTVNIGGTFSAGATYSVTLYTESGKMYQAVVVAKP